MNGVCIRDGCDGEANHGATSDSPRRKDRGAVTWPRFGALVLFAAAAGGVVGYLVALLDGLIVRSGRL